MQQRIVYLVGSLILIVILVLFMIMRGPKESPASANKVVVENESYQLVSGGPGVFSESGDFEGAEFKKLRDAGREFVIIDVREPDEFASGRLGGAKNIPLGSLEGRLGEIPKDKDVVLVCRSGRRSGVALEKLKANGYTKVHNLLGGMTSWDGEVEK